VAIGCGRRGWSLTDPTEWTAAEPSVVMQAGSLKAKLDEGVCGWLIGWEIGTTGWGAEPEPFKSWGKLLAWVSRGLTHVT
jgi:hypothetical protein